MVDGAPVVDLWGGSADAVRGEPWLESTMSVYYSMTKGLITLIVARLAEQGSIELDAPLARYWPEFAQAGKQAITVRQVMAHRAGLSYPVDDITRDDILAWDPIIRGLERQEPLWEPGTAHQYHALSYGWLVGELVQRVTGLSIGAAFAEFVAGPAGADAWIGVPTDQLDRVARVVPGPGFVLALPDEVPNAMQLVRALTLGGGLPADVAGDGTGLNDPVLQQAAIPAGLGIGTARALAQMWSGSIVATDASQPISDAVLDDMTAPQSSGAPLWSAARTGLPDLGDRIHGAERDRAHDRFHLVRSRRRRRPTRLRRPRAPARLRVPDQRPQGRG